MLTSESCAELAPPLTWASWKSWPWDPESRRVEPTHSQLRYLESGPCHSSPRRRHGRGKDTLLHTQYPLQSTAGRRDVINVGELSLPLTYCSTQERGSCTSPGNHSRADPGGRGTGEPCLRCEHGRAGPATCLLCDSRDEEICPFSPPLESRPAPHLGSIVESVLKA